MKASGRFKLVVENLETGKKNIIDWQENLFLNNFWSTQFSSSAQYVYCNFGTGTANPTVNDVALSNPILPNSSVSSTRYMASTPSQTERVGDIFTRKFSYTMVGSQGSIQGNITELGLGWATGSSPRLFTRALIKDDQGAPTTLTLGPNDILTVIYEISYSIDLSSGNTILSKVFDFNGVATTATLKWVNWDTLHQTIDYTVCPFVLGSASINAASYALIASQFALFAVPYQGVIPNYNTIQSGDITLLATDGYKGNQTDVLTGSSIDKSWATTLRSYAEGVATGTWDGLLMSGKSINSNTTKIATFAMEFSPPLVKGANDVFTFDQMTMKSKGTPS